MLLNKITLKFALMWRCYSVTFSEMDTYLIGVWLCENQRTVKKTCLIENGLYLQFLLTTSHSNSEDSLVDCIKLRNQQTCTSQHHNYNIGEGGIFDVCLCCRA